MTQGNDALLCPRRSLVALVLALLLSLLSSQTTEAFSGTRSYSKPHVASITRMHAMNRREAITTATTRGLLASIITSVSQQRPQQVLAGTTSSSHILVDSPMIRLQLPQAGVGRAYVAVKLMIDDKGPFEFMVDTGLTTELMTPHLQQLLGMSKKNQKTTTIQGLAAGGETIAQPLVELRGAALCDDTCSPDNRHLLKLPPLHAVVTDFPQEHLDPRHDPVEGMIGMELLSLFDVDFDFPNNRIRFCKPGTAAKAASKTQKLVEIPAVGSRSCDRECCEMTWMVQEDSHERFLILFHQVVINESGLIGIRVTIQGAKQPILGFLDCGSTFSCVNWASAPYLDIPAKNDPMYQKVDKYIQAVGVDGRLLKLPLIRKQVTFAGNAKLDKSGRPIGFEAAPSEFKPWKPVDLGVGDIPAFASLLGDGVHPFDGPAALIGLDILSQRRVIFEAGSPKSRARRVFVSAE